MSVKHVFVSGHAQGGQKVILDNLELELEKVLSLHLGARKQV